MDPIQKKTGFLTYPRTNRVPMPTERDTWHECTIVKDSFYALVNALPLDVASPIESVEGDKHDVY